MAKLCFFIALLLSATTVAKVRVVTTLPDLAWAIQSMGGDLVSTESLLEGTENPHYMDASPYFIASVSRADIVCAVGLELEIGWLPKVLSRSGNSKVQPGGKGHCEFGKSIKALEVPTAPINRSMGDVHPGGNPHFWLSPTRLAQGAEQAKIALQQTDPANYQKYEKGWKQLQTQMKKLQDTNRKKLSTALAQNKAPQLLEYHKEFSYFLEAYGLSSFGTVEEKPGVPPSAGRLGLVAQSVKGSSVKFILAAEYSPTKTVKRFSELSGLIALQVPTATRKSGKLSDYPSFQNFVVEQILSVLLPQSKT